MLQKLPPSCKDGKQNRDEEGIDCGGEFCDKKCPTQKTTTISPDAYFK